LSSCGERVQKSAFECWITKREQRALEEKALEIIDEAEDSLIIYCIDAAADSKRYGVSPKTEENFYLGIVAVWVYK
jgi:CRISPR-associated endonuclease Cas2